MKSRIIISTLLMTALSSSALAGKVHWGSMQKKVGYATIVAGVAVTVGSSSVARSGEWKALNASIGVGVAAVGGASIVNDIFSELLANPEVAVDVSAQHRSIVHQAMYLLSGGNEILDPNFDALMSSFKCSQCKTDLEKSKKLASLIVACDNKGKDLSARDIKPPISLKTEGEIYEFSRFTLVEELGLGEKEGKKNIPLAQRLVAMALLDKTIQQR